jgi:Cu/Ag efflux protein CusF
MKRTILAASLLVPVLALAQPKGAIVTEQVEAVVTVTKVDQKARTVTMRGPRGNLQTLQVPPEAQNLGQVKAGDRFKMTYAESAVVAITRGGQPHAAVEDSVQVAPKGGNPGGYKVRTIHMSGVVDAIDYKNRLVSLRGPKGNTVALPVSSEIKDLEQLKVGDKISVAYSQGLALEMIPQEKPAAKPAAKKKS